MIHADRAEATRRALECRCGEAGLLVTGDGRVSEADAAALLGLAAGTLRNLRAQGEGPASYRVAINGCRVSYRLADLASWIEIGRDDTQRHPMPSNRTARD